MLEINIHNVEEIIFENDKLWLQIPHLKSLKEQWKLGKYSPILRSLCKKSLLDFLNKANKEDEIIISKFLNANVTINKLDYNLVKNYEFNIENIENDLNLLKNEFFNFFSFTRKNEKINITFWR